MSTTLQPRAGSPIDRAMQSIRMAGRPLSMQALAVAIDQFEDEVPALLRYGVRMGVLAIEQRDGVDWYDIGSGEPIAEPTPPAPSAPPPAPQAVERIVAAPEAPVRPSQVGRVAVFGKVKRRDAPSERASEGVDIDRVHKHDEPLEPTAPAPAPRRAVTDAATGFLQLMDMEVTNAGAALALARLRYERLVELQAEARAAMEGAA